VQDIGPQGPRGLAVGGLGRARAILELADRLGSLSSGRPQTVRAGVAAADDDYVSTFSRNERLDAIALAYTVGVFEILHGEVDSTEFPTRNIEIARMQCPEGEDHRVVLLP